MNVRDIRRVVREQLASVPDLAAVYLFGSAARGDTWPQSDVDIGLIYGTTPPATLVGRPFDLADRLTEVTGHRFDVVVLNDAPVDLVHRALSDGVLLLENNASARIRFEVTARNAYFDLLPHVERYRRGARP